MSSKTITQTSRFDTRLSKEQKDFFEYAASLAGFRTLTEFILSSVQEKAKAIIKEHEMILSSERDRKVFFDAILNPPSPNKALKDAAKEYKNQLKKK